MDGVGVRRGARGHRDREMGGRVGSREVDGWLGMMFGNLMLPKIIVLKMIWDFVLPYIFGNSAGPQSKLQALTWRIGFSDLPNNPTNHENATWCLNMRQSGTSMCPVFEDVVPWSRLCCFEAPHSFVLDYIHT